MNKKNYDWNLNEVLELFETIEKRNNLGDHKINNINWWDFIRYNTYRELLEKLNLEKSKVKKIKKKNWSIKKLFFFLLNIFSLKSPIWIKRSSIIIFSHQRRIYENKYFIDKYVDPFIDIFKKDNNFSVIEDPLNLVHFNSFKYLHFSPAKTKKLFYGEFFIFFSRILSKFFITSLTTSEKNVIKKLEKDFKNNFNVEIKLVNKINYYLPIYKSKLFIYKTFFKIKKPKKILLVNSAGKEPIIEAAKHLHIPTYELQHGSPSRGKLNYDYSSGIKKKTFPDFFLSFGKFWSNDYILPLKKSHIINTGFPYLNQKISNIPIFSKKENIFLIISQPDISKKLINFTLDLRKKLKKKIKILYKPHPLEIFNNDLNYLDILKKNNIEVLKDYNSNLYKILEKSKWVMGISSTVLYEALPFKCQVFVLKLSGHEKLLNLINLKLVYLVKTTNEISNLVKKKYVKKSKNLFFNDNNNNIKKLFATNNTK